jgi:predicted ATPase
MRFRRVALQNWKNFESVDLVLQNRVFIVGANAIGKSNLLDVFRFLRDVARDGLRQGLSRREGLTSIRCLAAREKSQVRIEIEVGDEERSIWRYELELNQHDQHDVVTQERVTHLPDNRVILSRPDAQDKRDPERLHMTSLEQVSANQDFRELQRFLEQTRYHNPIPQLIRTKERRFAEEDDFHGARMLEELNELTEKNQKTQLKLLERALQSAVPQLSELKLVRDRAGRPHLQAKYEHWRPQGKKQQESLFSDGTLRLLSLVWELSKKGQTLLLEEPEQSLHTAIVRRLPSILFRTQQRSHRQVILTTHHEAMLMSDNLPLDEIVLLRPSTRREGGLAMLASDDPKLVARAGAHGNIADLVESHTTPADIEALLRLEIGAA